MAKKTTTAAADPAEIGTGIEAAAEADPALIPPEGTSGPALPAETAAEPEKVPRTDVPIRQYSGFRILSPVDHDGIRYECGTTLSAEALSTTEAAALLAAGCISAL